MPEFKQGYYRKREQNWEIWSDAEEFARGDKPELTVLINKGDDGEGQELVIKLQEGDFDGELDR